MSRNSLVFIWCLILLFGHWSLSYAAGEKWRDWTPLPEEITIIPPGPEIPPKVAHLSGIWQDNWTDAGMWDLGLPVAPGRAVTIVVEEITGSGATVIYSWGSWRNDKPGWFRANAAIQNDTIIIRSARETDKADYVGRKDRVCPMGSPGEDFILCKCYTQLAFALPTHKNTCKWRG